jgi:hypothetical protein
LLFAHAEGVSDQQARAYLSSHKWSSTDFYTTYYQPGALVTVSRAYPPDIYARHHDYFLQRRLDHPAEERAVPRETTPQPEAGVIGYDMLSEYPPLRYLGLLPGLFATIYEESLRQAYDRLLVLQQRQPLSWRFWRLFLRERELNRIAVALAIADNFEHLRLPVSRGLVKSLIDAKLQENVAANVRDLKGSNLNALVFVLTIIATVIAIWQALPVDTLADKLTQVFTYFGHLVSWAVCAAIS